jgi:hypothetical protein
MGTVTVSVMPKDYVSHVASAGNVPPHWRRNPTLERQNHGWVTTTCFWCFWRVIRKVVQSWNGHCHCFYHAKRLCVTCGQCRKCATSSKEKSNAREADPWMGHHHSFLMFFKGYKESSAVLKWALSLFASCQKTMCHMWPVSETRLLIKGEIQRLRGRTMDGSPPLIFDVFEGLWGK